MSTNNKEKLIKELEGIENTIWAYKFEFHDIEESQRKEVITEYEKRKQLIEAKIKMIDAKEKLKNM